MAELYKTVRDLQDDRRKNRLRNVTTLLHGVKCFTDFLR